jgi:hypothetical protein
MTYAPFGALGADCPPDCYSPYWQLWQSTDDVYVLRLRVSGAVEMSSSSAALLWAKAAGQLQRQTDLSVSGVAIEDLGGGNWLIEVVFTSATSGSVTYQLGWKHNVDTLGSKIAAHPDVVAEWPGVRVAPVEWLELDGPPSAVSYWRAAPILWSHSLPSPGGFGGPTMSFGRGEGAWVGSAANRLRQLQPQPVLPVGKKTDSDLGTVTASSLVALGIGALILWLALGSSRKATS